jgi:arylsulfatase A-like enzyme
MAKLTPFAWIAAVAAGILSLAGHQVSAAAVDGSELPFPPVPSASKAGPTLQTSVHHRRAQPNHLAKDAPNVLIILIDDVGYGQASTYGGEINTPNLTRIAQSGISYNAFHNTSICSPTRAALLTGRNHQRVGSGTIAERAVDWDGYTGVIPKTSATVAEVLKNYGYKTAAFGKWHNTPADQTTAMGPFDKWPNGYGFEYFYGFLAGETSQWEPRLAENTSIIEPPNTPGYHLTEDLADHAIGWLKKHQSYTPDKPFFIYFATGGAHGPHHVAPAWTAKYKGKFDDGYEAMRERIIKRQKESGWVPQATEADPTRRVDAGLGQHSGIRAPLPVAPDGNLCRFRRAYRRPGRSRHRRSWSASASATTRSSCTSSATTARAPKASAVRSANCWRRTTSRTRSTSRLPH